MSEPQEKPITKNGRRYATLNPSREVGREFKRAAAHIGKPLTEATDRALVDWLTANHGEFPHIQIPELKG